MPKNQHEVFCTQSCFCHLKYLQSQGDSTPPWPFGLTGQVPPDAPQLKNSRDSRGQRCENNASQITKCFATITSMRKRRSQTVPVGHGGRHEFMHQRSWRYPESFHFFANYIEFIMKNQDGVKWFLS